MERCSLCDIVRTEGENRSIQNAILSETEHFQWIPGLGAFVEGYSLIVSKEHLLNTGALPLSSVKELTRFIRKARSILREIYGGKTLVFEHGSMGEKMHGGCCVEHHHLHILPCEMTSFPEVVLRNFKKVKLFRSLEDLRDFHVRRVPYIYLSIEEGTDCAFEVSIIPRQYMRQVVAAQMGVDEKWDWREHPFMENVERLVRKVREREC